MKVIDQNWSPVASCPAWNIGITLLITESASSSYHHTIIITFIITATISLTSYSTFSSSFLSAKQILAWIQNQICHKYLFKIYQTACELDIKYQTLGNLNN